MIKRSCKGSSCIGYLEERIDEIDYLPEWKIQPFYYKNEELYT